MQAPSTEDRYPSAHRAIQAVINADDFPEGPVERIEVYCLASGEATWRVWEARAEEAVGGHLSEADLG